MTQLGSATLTVERGSSVVLTLGGEIDTANAAEVGQRLDDEVGDVGDVILDISGTTFMDSSGIAAVNRLRRRLTDEGRGLRIVAPPGSIPRKALEIIGLDVPIDDAR